MNRGKRSEAWVETKLICGLCCGNVMCCDSLDSQSDYEYYCSNEHCENHVGTRLYDSQEPPMWADRLDR